MKPEPATPPNNVVAVWLNGDEVKSLEYPCHSPQPFQFFTSAQYITLNLPPHPTPPSQSMAQSTGGPEACRAEAVENGPHTEKTKKRKRKRSGYVPNAREVEANKRHKVLEPILANAISHFNQAILNFQFRGKFGLNEVPSMWIDDTGGQHRVWKAVGCDLMEINCEIGGENGRNGVDDGGGGQEESLVVDWAALEALKSVIKPKFVQFAPFNAQNQQSDCMEITMGCNPKQKGREQGGGVSTELSDVESLKLFGCVHSNECDHSIECWAHEACIVMPPRSSFLMSDVRNLDPLMPCMEGDCYDLILMDPPWENKSASRSGTYTTLPSRHLLSLPMDKLMKQDGCVVCIWLTNRIKHEDFLYNELLPKWNLHPITTWYWLKVDVQGNLVSPLESNHRRPYEKLLIASNTTDNPAFGGIPPNLVVFGMPGAHSRKPPIQCILRQFVGENGKCLEMFARELVSDWTSWGNEVLCFQSSGRFSKKECRVQTPEIV